MEENVLTWRHIHCEMIQILSDHPDATIQWVEEYGEHYTNYTKIDEVSTSMEPCNNTSRMYMSSYLLLCFVFIPIYRRAW